MKRNYNPLEEFKVIQGYETYTISNFGTVGKLIKGMTKSGRKLKPSVNCKGYKKIGLVKEGKKKNHSVSRLVAIHFLPNPNNLPVVKHLDNNPLNNHYTNLAWGTHKSNSEDAAREGLYKKGENHSNAVLTEKKVKEIHILLALGVPIKNICTLYTINKNTAEYIKAGKTWKHLNLKPLKGTDIDINYVVNQLKIKITSTLTII